MRWTVVGAIAVLAGCGGGKAARPVPSPTPTEAVAAASGPWSAPAEGKREPLACPASSSRAQFPDRMLALGGERYAALTGSQPELDDLAADGRVLARTPVPAREPVSTRALACDAGGRLAVAWTEARGGRMALRVALRAAAGRALGTAQTVATRPQIYDEDPIYDLEIAFAPNGELLVAYSMLQQIRAVALSPEGKLGTEVRLGHASEISDVVAEIAGNGRAVVAWSTVDSGEERNTHRYVYAASRTPGGLFAPAQVIHRARAVIPDGVTTGEQATIRLAVAADGRALLLWGAEAAGYPHERYEVRIAEAPPHRGFGRSRQLSRNGYPADVALRTDGAALVAWRTPERLWAAVHPPGEPFHGREAVSAKGGTPDVVATFDTDGRPRLQWSTGFSIREAP